MAVLNIRNLPDYVHRRLRLRAARAGRSMEAEAREILAAACASSVESEGLADLPDWVAELYGHNRPEGVVEALIAERRQDGEVE